MSSPSQSAPSRGPTRRTPGSAPPATPPTPATRSRRRRATGCGRTRPTVSGRPGAGGRGRGAGGGGLGSVQVGAGGSCFQVGGGCPGGLAGCGACVPGVWPGASRARARPVGARLPAPAQPPWPGHAPSPHLGRESGVWTMAPCCTGAAAPTNPCAPCPPPAATRGKEGRVHAYDAHPVFRGQQRPAPSPPPPPCNTAQAPGASYAPRGA